jgi:cytochrome b561/polyisoprenoid-binding protein YceI
MSGAVRYNAVAMIIHWLTALTVIGLLVVGNIMADLPRTDPNKLDLYNLHKSFGITILLLTVIRLGWRLTHKPPSLPDAMPNWEKRAAHAAHWVFYLLLLGVPLLGWIMVSAAPRSVPTFLFGVLEWPHISFLADMELDQKKELKEVFEDLHAAAAYTMAGLIVLHIGAALRHRLLLKDNVLQRMLPKVIPALALAFGLALAMPVSATEWSVDPAASNLGFTATQSGRTFEGRFKSWQAEIEFDKADLSKARAKVLIDMASASTADRQRDSSLPGADWFDAKKFPQATFEASGFTSKGGNKYEASGTLEIRGNKKNVTLPFTLDITGDESHAVGKLDIVRSDYGVGQGEWMDGSVVGLAVSITFDLVAKKKL